MQMVNKVELLRSMFFTEEDFQNIINKQDFPEFTEADISFMVEFKKIYEMGEPQLIKFLDKLNAEGSQLDSYSIDYYTSVLKAGPFGNMLQDILVNPEDHAYWRQLTEGVGMTADNNHTPVNTAGYSDSPPLDGPNLRLLKKLPNCMRITLGVGLSGVNGIFYTSLKSANVIDNTYNKKNPQETYNQAQDGTLQETSHGGYWVTDVKFLKTIQKESQNIKEIVRNMFKPEEQRRLDDIDVGNLTGEFTTTVAPIPTTKPPQQASTPVSLDFPSMNSEGTTVGELLPDLDARDDGTFTGQPTSGEFDFVETSEDDIGLPLPFPISDKNSAFNPNDVGNVDVSNNAVSDASPPTFNTSGAASEFAPTVNNVDNISKIFLIQKLISENGKTRMIELDLFGNEIDSDARRDRLLKIDGKDFDKNLNLNFNEGQLGNASDPNSVNLVNTTLPPRGQPVPDPIYISGVRPPGLPVPNVTASDDVRGVPPPKVRGPSEPTEVSQPKTRGLGAPNNLPPPNQPPTDLSYLPPAGNVVVTPPNNIYTKPLLDDGRTNITARNSWILSLPDGERNQNGIITISTYGRLNDPNGDSDTKARRGFSENLLRVGSVALSPDIYKHYNCAMGSSVYLAGHHLGFYEDRAPDEHEGQPYGLCIDIYDPTNLLGDQLKKGGYSQQLTFGPRREQIANPSKKK